MAPLVKYDKAAKDVLKYFTFWGVGIYYKYSAVVNPDCFIPSTQGQISEIAM